MKKGLVNIVAIVMLAVLPFSVIGCTSADVAKAVALVAAELPTALALAQDALSIVAGLGVNANVQIPVDKVQALEALCNDYTAHPSSNTFDQVVALVDQLVNQGDSDLLTVAAIKDPATAQKATAVLAALDAVLHIIDGYVTSAQSTKQVQARAQARRARLKAVTQYWTEQQKNDVAAKFNMPYDKLMQIETRAGF